MGIDLNRFVEPVDEEFKCSICLNVLEKPVHGSCGHVFCRLCIMTWLESGPAVRAEYGTHRLAEACGSCPVDRQILRPGDLIDAALPFKALLSRLKIRCDYEEFGCSEIVTTATLSDHLKVCNFNPEEEILCRQGCAKLFRRKHLVKEKHNCIKELQSLILRQEQAISELRQEKHITAKTCQNLNFVILLLVAVLFGIIVTAFLPSSKK